MSSLHFSYINTNDIITNDIITKKKCIELREQMIQKLFTISSIECFSIRFAQLHMKTTESYHISTSRERIISWLSVYTDPANVTTQAGHSFHVDLCKAFSGRDCIKNPTRKLVSNSG